MRAVLDVLASVGLLIGGFAVLVVCMSCMADEWSWLKR